MKQRIIGLDIFRSILTLLILLSHSFYFTRNPVFISGIDWYALFGIIGVDAFAILSGFLIGNNILQNFIAHRSNKNLYTFYKNRALRILPLYYLGYLVFIIVKYFLHSGLLLFFKPLIFIQNFDPNLVEIYPAAWFMSLVVFFYFITPLIFYYCLSKNPTKSEIFNLIIAIIFIVSSVRFIFVIFFQLDWEFGIKRNPFLRLDSFFIGIILAYIKLYEGNLFRKLATFKLLLGAIISILFINLYFIKNVYFDISILHNNIFFKTYFFLLNSIILSLLLPFFYERIQLTKEIKIIGWIKQSIVVFSNSSYALYLVHLTVFNVIIYYWSDYYIQNNLGSLFFILSCLVSFGVSYVLTYINNCLIPVIVHKGTKTQMESKI